MLNDMKISITNISIYLATHAYAETLITGRVMPSGTSKVIEPVIIIKT